MKLHGNAALSLKKRGCSRARRRAGLVARRGGRGRRGERAHCPQVGRAATAPRASAGCSTAPPPRTRVHNRTDETHRGDRRAAAAALHRARDRRAARVWRARRCPPCSPGSGWASSRASSRPSRSAATRESRAGELLHIDVKKLGRIQGGAGHRVTGKRQHEPRRTDARRAGGAAGRLGVRARLRRRRQPAGLRRGARRRAGDTRDRVPAPRLAFYRAHGVSVERVMTDNGSAYVSAVFGLACRAARHQALPHPALSTADQRQGRALHPHDARRVGICRVYGSSAERTAALPGWLERYNTSRRHGALGHRPPIARLRELQRTT